MTQKKNKQVAFYLIAFVVPILFILAIEGVLRLAGFGQTIPLFVKSADFVGYSQPNPEIIQRYFPTAEQAPKVSPDTVYFKTEKDPQTFRIVIQGGSSAAGFPFGRFGSLQGMLEQRFKRSYPNKNIEIINTAMAAVNSYTLLDFTAEIKQIDPDLVLIYAGHNEYLGVLGVGSAFASKGGRAATLAYLKLKDLALYQAIESVYSSVMTGGDTEPNSPQGSRTLMSQVAKGKFIPFDSEIYHAGIEQFSGNISAILATYKAANIPVMIGNLVSIEKELTPFSSLHQTQNKGIDEQPDAGAVYQAANTALEQQKLAKARQLFSQARDLDELRFRAPSAFNQVLEEIAAEFGAILVNVEDRIRQESPDGLIGKQFMLEHVHPTLTGYFLLADAFHQQIIASGVMGQAKKQSLQQAWQDVPVTELSRMYAALRIKQLTSSYPFTTSTEPMELPQLKNTGVQQLLKKRLQGESWFVIQQQLLQYYELSKNYPEALRVAGILSDIQPMSDKAANIAASLARQVGDHSLSIYYQNRSLSIAPDNNQYMLNLAHSYFLVNDYQQSLALIEKAGQSGADKKTVEFFRNKVSQVATEKGL